ncbi:hypothetical protein [Azospirillum brasilense]|uniref:Uncharacterized protein n=1 Tax=Azospirillum brasilense TaxID=192 RepID=A0A235HAC5_AZOBR|nr:hypothetical protein [Azospirillum brasilense]OYD82779.1 hypothetical protein CHT98_19140 [Azospirillum brasilense]
MHLADLFVALRHQLDRNPKETERAAERLEFAPDDAGGVLRRLAELLDAGDGTDALKAWVDSSDERTPLERCVLAAQAIDRWFAPLASRFLSRSALSDGRLRARQWYKRHGRFNSDAAEGQLILRPGLFDRSVNIREVTPLRGSFDVADLFHTLLLLPPTLAAECPHGEDGERPVSVAFHRVAEVADQCPSDPDWAPVVGVVPLALAEEDLVLGTFSKDGADWYAATPGDLGARASSAIDALAAEGATIVVFPEVAADPATLGAIKAAVRRQAVDGPIRYVLVGVRQDGEKGGKPRSTAVLLDRTGAEMFCQTKLHCWDLDADQCRSYDVRGPDGRLLDEAKEFIAPGDGVTIVELPNMGRLAVMICEDLGREKPAAWLCRAKLLDWIVTPVMDAGLTEERWQAHAGDESSRAGSCRVVVANSMSFSHRFNRVCDADGQEDKRITDCGVALFFQPRADPAQSSRIRRLSLPIDAPEPGCVAARWEPRSWAELKTEGCP